MHKYSKKGFLLIALMFANLFFCSSPITANAATVDVYPMASCFQIAGNWAVTANGTNLPVRGFKPHGSGTPQYYYAHCGISGGSVTFIVDAKENISTYSISPKGYNISATKAGTTLTFTLSTSKYLEIKVNNKPFLCLLVDPSETSPPASSGTGIYNVKTQYDADSTGASLVTANIQSAINAANSAGGGIVYLPAGVYLSNKINLKSNVSLYLAPGSVIYADPIASNWANPTITNNFIEANNVTNVKIYGRGTIDCRGCTLSGNIDPSQNSDIIQIRAFNSYHANGVVLEGIIVNESTTWTVNIREQSSNVNITNLKVINERTWLWNDGIDICGSHDVNVQHCFINTCDDAACAKAINYPTYNVYFDDIVADSADSSGFKVGNQAEFDIYNVWLTNFNVIDCDRGFNLDHWYGTGNWHDIHFVDWRVEQITGTSASLGTGKYIDCPFRMEISQQSSTSYDVGVGPISNIEVTRVTFDGLGPNASYLWGKDNTNNINIVNFTQLKMNGSVVSDWTTDLVNKGYTSNITWN